MSYHLKQYLFYRNILLQNNQYGGLPKFNTLSKIVQQKNENVEPHENVEPYENVEPHENVEPPGDLFFPTKLKDFFENLNFDFIQKEQIIVKIYMNEINKLYMAKKNEILIYGTSIFDHKIIYVLLENGEQCGMILEIDDKDYSKFFNHIKTKINKVILKNYDKYILNDTQRKEYDKIRKEYDKTNIQQFKEINIQKFEEIKIQKFEEINKKEIKIIKTLFSETNNNIKITKDQDVIKQINKIHINTNKKEIGTLNFIKKDDSTQNFDYYEDIIAYHSHKIYDINETINKVIYPLIIIKTKKHKFIFYNNAIDYYTDVNDAIIEGYALQYYFYFDPNDIRIYNYKS